MQLVNSRPTLSRRSFLAALTIAPALAALVGCGRAEDAVSTDPVPSGDAGGSAISPLEGIAVQVWRDPG